MGGNLPQPPGFVSLQVPAGTRESWLCKRCCPAVLQSSLPKQKPDRLREVKPLQESLPSCCRYLVSLSLGWAKHEVAKKEKHSANSQSSQLLTTVLRISSFVLQVLLSVKVSKATWNKKRTPTLCNLSAITDCFFLSETLQDSGHQAPPSLYRPRELPGVFSVLSWLGAHRLKSEHANTSTVLTLFSFV